MTPVRVAIAGSTGSIGTQTLDVIEAENDRAPGSYEVAALAAGRSVDVLVDQVLAHRPAVVVVSDPEARTAVAERLAAAGVDQVVDDALSSVVEPADVVVNAVVGFAGLDVTVDTLRAGKRLGLANKESLIAAGPVVQPLRATPGAELVPIDSEHNAIFQCLPHDQDRKGVRRRPWRFERTPLYRKANRADERNNGYKLKKQSAHPRSEGSRRGESNSLRHPVQSRR